MSQENFKVLWNSETLLERTLTTTSSSICQFLPPSYDHSQAASVYVRCVAEMQTHSIMNIWETPVEKRVSIYPKHVIGYDCREAGSRRNQERRHMEDVWLLFQDPSLAYTCMPLSRSKLVWLSAFPTLHDLSFILRSLASFAMLWKYLNVLCLCLGKLNNINIYNHF